MSNNHFTDIVGFRKKVQNKRMSLQDLLRVKYSKNHEFKEKILNDPIIGKYYFSQLDKNIFTEDFTKYFNNQYFYNRENSSLESEIVWNCLIFKKHFSELNSFNEYRLRYENYFFKNNYDYAKTLLEEIEDKFGVSLWLIENKMLLEEFYSENSKMNIGNIMKEYSKNCSNFQAFLVNKISERITDDFSLEKYSERLSTEIEDSSLPIEIKLFSVFWLDFHNFPIKDRTLSSALVISFNTSLIDRYNMTIRILQHLTDKKEYEGTLKKCIDILSSIEDLRLSKIKATYRKDGKFLNISENDLKFNNILDEYTKGNYCGSLKLIPEAFEQSSEAFKILDIYNKSLLLSNSKPDDTQKIFEAPFLNEVSNSYFEVLTKSDVYFDSIKKLLVLTRKFGANDWAIQMYYSIFSQVNNINSKEKELHVFLNSPLNTVNDSVFIIDGKSKKNYLSQFKNDSQTLRLWKYYNTDDFIVDLEEIPYYRKLVYEAKKEMKSKEFGFQDLTNLLIRETQKMTELEELDNQLSLNYFKEKIRYELYHMLMADKNYIDSLDMVVESFLENSINFQFFNTNDLLKTIEEESKNELITSKIETLIFMKLRESSKLSYFFELFSEQRKLFKPNNLTIDAFSTNKVIYFFEEICNISVLADQVLVFERHEDIEEERLNILRQLISINPSSERIYTEEISRISQDKLLRNLMQKVNQSKLFVDVNRIWEEKKDSISESILKFLEADTGKVRYYNINKQEVLLEDMSKTEGQGFFYLVFETPKQKELRNVLNEVLNYFLSNNEYGLDTYLSTRIRHGTLQGQLRSPFQKHNLITTRKNDKSDEYISNDIMIERFNGNAKSINKIFSEFSYKIDNLIENVKKNWMQIKFEEKNPEGMFDFNNLETSFETLYNNVEQEKSPKIIFDLIIQHLWDETEKSLDNIRKSLKKELCEQFIELLTQLQDNLSNEEIGDNTFVNRKISECKTDVQISIDEAASWFERVDPSDDMKVTSFELIELCKRIRENISPEFKNIKFSFGGNDQITLSGRELPYYVDILLILIDNSIKHSHLSLDELNVEMYIESIEKQTQILVKNNFNSKNSNKIDQAILEIEDRLSLSQNQSTDLVKVEGGSGYLKIFKVIKYDLQAKPIINLSRKDNMFFSKIRIGGKDY